MIDSTTRHGILATLALRRLATSGSTPRVGRPSPYDLSVTPRTMPGGHDAALAAAARPADGEARRRRMLRPSSVM